MTAETGPNFQHLYELTPQSAKVGAWIVKIAEEPKEWEYNYNWGGKTNKGRRLEVMMVSPKAEWYCIGICVRRGDNPKSNADFVAMVKKFKKGSIWRMTKVSLSKEKTPSYTAL